MLGNNSHLRGGEKEEKGEEGGKKGGRRKGRKKERKKGEKGEREGKERNLGFFSISHLFSCFYSLE